MTTNENKGKRKRATREEMIARTEAKLAKLRAEAAGEVPATEDGILKALRNRLRKTETALRAATITLDGVVLADGKGWAREPIDAKIERAEQRLASARQTKANAEEMRAQLPFDVDRLKALVDAGAAGEEVSFPDDLVPLPGEQNRTDEEIEADYIAQGEGSDD